MIDVTRVRIQSRGADVRNNTGSALASLFPPLFLQITSFVADQRELLRYAGKSVEIGLQRLGEGYSNTRRSFRIHAIVSEDPHSLVTAMVLQTGLPMMRNKEEKRHSRALVPDTTSQQQISIYRTADGDPSLCRTTLPRLPYWSLQACYPIRLISAPSPATCH